MIRQLRLTWRYWRSLRNGTTPTMRAPMCSTIGACIRMTARAEQAETLLREP